MADTSASEEIDAIIKRTAGWHGERLAQLRTLIKRAAPAAVEEVKWKRPSRPEGVPVWSYEGNICIAEALKNTVRLTFPKGALIPDPSKVFNARLDSKTVRAIDFYENDAIDEAAVSSLIEEAVKLHSARS